LRSWQFELEGQQKYLHPSQRGGQTSSPGLQTGPEYDWSLGTETETWGRHEKQGIT